MDKPQLHHLWTRIRRIKPWYFLCLAIIFGFISLMALRSNNLHMIKLRDAVYQADKNNGDVNGALITLRNYVFAHMNTNLASGDHPVYPPIQLQYTYDRLVQQHAEQAKTDNKQVYAEAENHCAGYPEGDTKTTCVQDYVKQRLLEMGQAIPDGMYKFNFASPRWSPDLAGWSLVLTAVFFAAFVASWLFERWLRLSSR